MQRIDNANKSTCSRVLRRVSLQPNAGQASKQRRNRGAAGNTASKTEHELTNWGKLNSLQTHTETAYLGAAQPCCTSTQQQSDVPQQIERQNSNGPDQLGLRRNQTPCMGTSGRRCLATRVREGTRDRLWRVDQAGVVQSALNCAGAAPYSRLSLL